jgi:membrane protein DedA with SNARE-associated domain
MRILASGNPPPLPGFLNSLAGPLDHYGYWAIALLLLLENIGVPVIPGEFAMIAGAIFAGTGRAGLNIVVVGIVAVIATSAGAEVGYLIGKYAGRELILRYGKYVFIKPHHLDRAEAIVSRYGGIVVVIARYVVGLREANGIIAGITQMRWLTFSAYNLIGACAWVATWVTIGDIAGDHIDTVYKDVNRFSLYLLIVLAVLLAAYIVRRVLRRRGGSSGARESSGTRVESGAGVNTESPEGSGIAVESGTTPESGTVVESGTPADSRTTVESGTAAEPRTAVESGTAVEPRTAVESAADSEPEENPKAHQGS